MAAEACGRPGSVAGIASHAAVRMGERGVVARHLGGHDAIFVHQLRTKRFLAEMHVTGRDAVDGLNDLPFPVFIRHGALKNSLAARFETAHPPGCTQRIEMPSADWGCRARCDQRSLLANRAVAIDAIDFDGGAGFAVNFPVTVIVLREMAIVALHPFSQMDVGEVYGFAESIWIVEGNLLAVPIEPVSFAVVIENSAKYPAVAMEISELRRFQLLVEFGTADCLQEFFIVPEGANRGAFRIAFQRLIALLFGGVALLFRIHFVAIDFVVPPGEPEIRGDHVRAGMNVADHALARRNRARENVLDGVARLILRNRRIGRSAEDSMAEWCVSGRM